MKKILSLLACTLIATMTFAQEAAPAEAPAEEETTAEA